MKQCCGSGSVIFWVSWIRKLPSRKKIRKALTSTVLRLLYVFLSLTTNVNVTQKVKRKFFFELPQIRIRNKTSRIHNRGLKNQYRYGTSTQIIIRKVIKMNLSICLSISVSAAPMQKLASKMFLKDKDIPGIIRTKLAEFRCSELDTDP